MKVYLKSIYRFALGLAALSLVAIGDASAQPQDGAFQFSLIGDMPYTTVQQQQYQRVLAALNKTDLAFVVHVGDFQNDPRGYYPNPAIGLLPCLDENYKAIYESFQSVRHPFILTPGDNDWADCHLVKEPKIDPLERLAKVRAMFFPEGRSLGQRTIPVENQAKDPQYAKFRENLRWSISEVTFVTSTSSAAMTTLAARPRWMPNNASVKLPTSPGCVPPLPRQSRMAAVASFL